MTFSFFLAAQLQVPVGSFLAAHWEQFPPEYAAMIGFLVLFVAGVVAFALIVQGTYGQDPDLRAAPGRRRDPGRDPRGRPGVAAPHVPDDHPRPVLLGSSYAPDPDEVPLLANIWTAINGSAFGQILHETAIPNFLGVVQFLIPQGILGLYGIR